jgi:hypothetical protein
MTETRLQIDEIDENIWNLVIAQYNTMANTLSEYILEEKAKSYNQALIDHGILTGEEAKAFIKKAEERAKDNEYRRPGPRSYSRPGSWRGRLRPSRRR